MSATTPSRPGPPKAIATPCVMVCAVDGESGLCLGCFRTLKEIAGWRSLSDAEAAPDCVPLHVVLDGEAPKGGVEYPRAARGRARGATKGRLVANTLASSTSLTSDAQAPTG